MDQEIKEMKEGIAEVKNYLLELLKQKNPEAYEEYMKQQQNKMESETTSPESDNSTN